MRCHYWKFIVFREEKSFWKDQFLAFFLLFKSIKMISFYLNLEESLKGFILLEFFWFSLELLFFSYYYFYYYYFPLFFLLPYYRRFYWYFSLFIIFLFPFKIDFIFTALTINLNWLFILYCLYYCYFHLILINFHNHHCLHRHHHIIHLRCLILPPPSLPLRLSTFLYITFSNFIYLHFHFLLLFFKNCYYFFSPILCLFYYHL